MWPPAPPGPTRPRHQRPAGHAALVERVRPLAPALVALEATGGYESAAVAAPQAAGLRVAAVDPRQARDFADATGRLARADRIDAEALAHFAEAIRPEARPAAAPERAALDALLARRRQVMEMRVMESDRLETCTDAVVRAAIERHVAWTWRDGVITRAPGKNEYGWLRLPVEVDDFVFQAEWKVPPKGNSGIFLRARPVAWFIPPGEKGKERVSTLGLEWPSRTGLELQAQDDHGVADKYSSGSLYRHAAPSENPTKPAGEWNRYTVRARGPRIEVWSNGRQVLDTTIDRYPTLRHPPLRGYIGLQNQGVGAEFRNIRYLQNPRGGGAERVSGA